MAMNSETWHSTTIIGVRRNGKVAMASDGQVTMGETIIKQTAKKVRRLHDGKVLVGFAGATADAFTLFQRFEQKLDEYSGNLPRAVVELAKDWRTDRVLRRLEALLGIMDAQYSYVVSGSGDVIEPDDGVVAVGSGGPYGSPLPACCSSTPTFRPTRLRARQSRPQPRSASTPTLKSQ